MFDELFRQTSEQNGMLFTIEPAVELGRRIEEGMVVQFIDGGHYNEAGNRIVGQVLAEFIRKNRLLVQP
jgi:hypothetical protein